MNTSCHVSICHDKYFLNPFLSVFLFNVTEWSLVPVLWAKVKRNAVLFYVLPIMFPYLKYVRRMDELLRRKKEPQILKTLIKIAKWFNSTSFDITQVHKAFYNREIIEWTQVHNINCWFTMRAKVAMFKIISQSLFGSGEGLEEMEKQGRTSILKPRWRNPLLSQVLISVCSCSDKDT